MSRSAPALHVPTAARPVVSASELKALGWRGVVDRAEAAAGELLVTSHGRPQAVILTPVAYEALVEEAQQQSRSPLAVEARLEELERRLRALEAQCQE